MNTEGINLWFVVFQWWNRLLGTVKSQFIEISGLSLSLEFSCQSAQFKITAWWGTSLHSYGLHSSGLW